MDLAPYIGITDFMYYDQAQAMQKVFEKHKPQGSPRLLHVGVMMSYKTLHNMETKWDRAFPPKQVIATIFCSAGTYNCLHYADFSEADIEFPKSLARAIGWGGMGIHAIQLDMCWPPPGDIAQAVHMSRKQLEVILQIGKKAMSEARYKPSSVAKSLDAYEGVIHRVLLDMSGGRGEPMKPGKLLPFARAIRERHPQLGITFAGGLGPESMHLMGPIIEEFPDASCDAQGRLRPSGNALDPIDWSMASEYLVRALACLP